MNLTKCIIEANPDVSGVGIRISAYSLCLGGRIVGFLVKMVSPTPNANSFNRSLRTAMSIQGLALLSTALYQTAHDRLTLFHAVVVLHLLALLGITLTTGAAVPGHSNETAHRIINEVVYLVTVAAFVAFNVLVWSRAPTFGSQPECNSTVVYVLFGVSIPATNDVFRYIILATFASVPGVFVISLFLSATCWMGMWCCLRHGAWRLRDSSSSRERPSFDTCSNDESTATWIRDSINIVAYAGMAIYAIVSLEQMVARNRVSDEERDWTFGQVLSLFLLFGVGNEVLNVVISSISGKPAGDEGGQRTAATLRCGA
ncbi:hypothetical protein N657DRAFT_640393 [Parathielavia appendiculata]|uniref:Uncharacterized protein n=1 Tax=Parathielavia appendiculata TaxID=2587402 RepID=A0AAN6Z9D0_9PEZI|nr:hypothetical protein N657DRAFT_640393 [Parathielavia appendiculata]